MGSNLGGNGSQISNPKQFVMRHCASLDELWKLNERKRCKGCSAECKVRRDIRATLPRRNLEAQADIHPVAVVWRVGEQARGDDVQVTAPHPSHLQQERRSRVQVREDLEKIIAYC